MAFHRAILVEHVNLYNPATIIRLRTLEAGFLAKGSSLPVARQQALAIVDRIVQGQAAVLSYADVFYSLRSLRLCPPPAAPVQERPIHPQRTPRPRCGIDRERLRSIPRFILWTPFVMP